MVEISRIRNSVKNSRFLKFIFSSEEINELEKRISMLEQKVKELSGNNLKNNSFDYQTSMHMM